MPRATQGTKLVTTLLLGGCCWFSHNIRNQVHGAKVLITFLVKATLGPPWLNPHTSTLTTQPVTFQSWLIRDLLEATLFVIPANPEVLQGLDRQMIQGMICPKSIHNWKGNKCESILKTRLLPRIVIDYFDLNLHLYSYIHIPRPKKLGT